VYTWAEQDCPGIVVYKNIQFISTIVYIAVVNAVCCKGRKADTMKHKKQK
jgi:hypothetical protein